MDTTDNTPRLKVGELARLAGKTVRAIHLYEEMELLTPAERSVGGFRLYDQANLSRIRLIEKLQRLGLSLPDIQQLLATWSQKETAPQAMAALEEIYRVRLTETRAKIAELQALEHELSASLDYLAGCRRCEAPTQAASTCTHCERPRAEKVDDLALITGLASH